MNKKDRMAATLLVDKTTQAIRDAAIAQREITKKQMELQREELETRDRVDISLKEYERIKEKILFLERENEGYREILSRFRFPLDAKIVPGSVNTSTCCERSLDPLKAMYACRIEFRVEGKSPWCE